MQEGILLEHVEFDYSSSKVGICKATVLQIGYIIRYRRLQ